MILDVFKEERGYTGNSIIGNLAVEFHTNSTKTRIETIAAGDFIG